MDLLHKVGEEILRGGLFMLLNENYEIIENLFMKYELPVAAIQKDIQHMQVFKVTTPIIGGFSTGKTSMINAFLDEKLLRTNITAETAVPTKISYGPVQVKAVKKDIEKYFRLMIY